MQPQSQKTRQYQLESPVISIVIIVLLPLYLTLVVPVAAGFFIWNVIRQLLEKKPNKPLKTSTENIVPHAKREFDLIVYGASGFTGNLVAHYLCKNYKDLSWAIAGRSERKMREIQATLLNQYGRQVSYVLADSSDPKTLELMVSRTRVIVSTVGPFELYGEPLVAQCAASGTDYCDTTGEFPFMCDMISKYSEIAFQSGARITHFCGLDSLPWDLMTYMANRQLKLSGDEMVSVHHTNELIFYPSGGTLSSIMNLLDKPPKSSSIFQYLNQGVGLERDTILKGYKVVPESIVLPKKYQRDGVRGSSVTQIGNLPIIRRSNALMRYSPNLIYQESQIYKNYFQWFNFLMFSVQLLTLLMIRPLRSLLSKFKIVKAPGEGPSDEFCQKAYLNVQTKGIGKSGKIVDLSLYFPNEPGYHDTARMLSECALTLIYDSQKLGNKPGGFYTTASLFGEHVLNRLIKTGCEFKVY